VPKWRDVCELSGKEIIRTVGRPTLISGGFPCQPHSLAGKRQASCDERDLTGELKRIVREVKPQWFLAENVPGLRSSESGRFFGKFLYDLSEMGYTVGWGSWRASDIGACHRRERVFIVAHNSGSVNKSGSTRTIKRNVQTGDKPAFGDASDTEGTRWGIFDPEDFGQTAGEGPTPSNKDRLSPDMHIPGSQRGNSGKSGEWQPKTGFGLRDAGSWPEVATRLCRVDDGVSSRVDRLKCLGNAVVPQQAYPILKAIADIEKGDLK
jgi:DNA (cytosine-5)-methyltransferase 1